MKRKLISILLTVLMFAMTFPVNYTYADPMGINESKEFKTVLENEELPLNMLLNNNVQKQRDDIKVSKNVKKTDNIITTEIQATQLLSKQIQNGSTIENMVSDVEVTVDDVSLDTVPVLRTLSSGSGSKTETQPEKTGSCKMTLRIYYTRTLINNKPMVYLTQVSGGITEPSPSRVKITLANLRFGQTGWAIGGYKEQSISYSVINNTKCFAYVPPSSWAPVADTSKSIVGATLSCSFYVSGSGGWSHEFSCNI